MGRSIVSHFFSLVIKCVNDDGYKNAGLCYEYYGKWYWTHAWCGDRKEAVITLLKDSDATDPDVDLPGGAMRRRTLAGHGGRMLKPEKNPNGRGPPTWVGKKATQKVVDIDGSNVIVLSA